MFCQINFEQKDFDTGMVLYTGMVLFKWERLLRPVYILMVLA